MTFMETVLKQNYPIWDKCTNTLFVQNLKSGTLPIMHFREYMIQDTIYLKHYAHVYGKAIYPKSSQMRKGLCDNSNCVLP